MNQPEFEEALDFKPNIAVIMLGTNDDLMVLHAENATFKDDYAKLIFAFQLLESKPQIWIVKPPPVFINSSDQSSTYLSQTIIPETEELASRLGLPIIDVYSAFGNRPDYFLDGVHPNRQGAQLIANIIYNALIPYRQT